MPIAITSEHHDLADSVRSLVARVAPSEVLHAALRESLEHLQPWGTWPDQNRSLSETREYVRRRRAW